MQKSDGFNYAPEAKGKIEVVCKPGEFRFAAIGLDHGHIYAMTNGLLEAGGEIKSVWDPDPVKMQAFKERFPQVECASSEEEILSDPEVKLVCSACVPCDRCSLGIRVMEAGKDYFADKPGMLTFDDIEKARETTKRTGRKYMIYFGERIHVEGAIYAQKLIEDGVIGDVLQVTIMAPHRLAKPTRADWFFEKDQNGGIIADVGSHQIEQFLSYCGAGTAKVLQSAVANYNNQDKPNFYDFGEAVLLADTGATGWFRVDWYTPEGLSAWGDGRVFIMGSKGTIEIRKYIDLAVSTMGDNVLWVDKEGEHRICATGLTGFVFFGQFIRDCLDRTETAMTQEHVFEAMRIAIEAQESAMLITGEPVASNRH